MPSPFAALIFVAAVALHTPAKALEECLIQPWKTIEVGARSTGVLDRLLIDRGSDVIAGQNIASLDADLEVAAVELARAKAESDTGIELAQARADYEKLSVERNRALFERRVISSQQMDEAEATHRIALLQVQQAMDDKRLAALELARATTLQELKTVVSPADGVVVSTDRSVGEYLTEGDHVATIAIVDPLRAEAFLPLERLAGAEEGMKVRVYPQQPIGGELEGVIDVIDRVVDARSGTVGIRVRIENPEHKALGGLRCELALEPAS